MECIFFLKNLLIYLEKENFLIAQDFKAKIVFYFLAVVTWYTAAIYDIIKMKAMDGLLLSICCEFTAIMWDPQMEVKQWHAQDVIKILTTVHRSNKQINYISIRRLF